MCKSREFSLFRLEIGTFSTGGLRSCLVVSTFHFIDELQVCKLVSQGNPDGIHFK